MKVLIEAFARPRIRLDTIAREAPRRPPVVNRSGWRMGIRGDRQPQTASRAHASRGAALQAIKVTVTVLIEGHRARSQQRLVATVTT